jgi:Holliday junction resolvase RusA-like endonuclease
MKKIYDIFVAGMPKAQPRPRMAKTGHMYNPPSADVWKILIKAAFRKVISTDAKPISGPVKLDIRFLFYRAEVPKDVLLPHTSKPDRDNLEKAVMDLRQRYGRTIAKSSLVPQRNTG